MTLHVPLDQFPTAVRRVTPGAILFVDSSGDGSVATAADPTKGVVIMCETPLPEAELKQRLEAEKFEVLKGTWGTPEPASQPAESHRSFIVAAVSYKSAESQPGCWVDIYPSMPTTALVLRDLYEEFQRTAEIGEASYEDFVKLAQPNVILVGPEQQQLFLSQKDC